MDMTPINGIIKEGPAVCEKCTRVTRSLGQGRGRSSYGLVAEGQNEATSGSWSGSKEGTKKST